MHDERSDPNPVYWEQYGPFQHVKHELIRCYLNGWYPKLGTWARSIRAGSFRPDEAILMRASLVTATPLQLI